MAGEHLWAAPDGVKLISWGSEPMAEPSAGLQAERSDPFWLILAHLAIDVRFSVSLNATGHIR